MVEGGEQRAVYIGEKGRLEFTRNERLKEMAKILCDLQKEALI